MVHGLPLVVVVCLDVNGTVQGGLQRVREQKHGGHRPQKSGPVPGQTDIKHTIALEGAE